MSALIRRGTTVIRMPHAPTPQDLTLAPANLVSLGLALPALITTSARTKERATTVTFMPLAPTLPDPSIAPAILVSMELESLALITTNALAKEVVRTATFMPPAPTLLALSPVLATRDSVEMV